MMPVKEKNVATTRKEMSVPCPYCNEPIPIKLISGKSSNSLMIQYYTIDGEIAECICKKCEESLRIRFVNNFMMIVKKAHTKT
ncbi:MAG TPA: hypothetical protein ENH26_01970 [Candidatus Wolfebacteria bacterium]|nr:hypothetical protein [Candidatus Wolfebacteria bacterium]